MNFETKSKQNEKLQFFSNILTEHGCGWGHRKYEGPFVKKEFHTFEKILRSTFRATLIS